MNVCLLRLEAILAPAVPRFFLRALFQSVVNIMVGRNELIAFDHKNNSEIIGNAAAIADLDNDNLVLSRSTLI